METKTLLQSKTFWVAALTFLGGLFTLVTETFGPYLSADTVGIMLMGSAAVQTLLRIATRAEIESVV